MGGAPGAQELGASGLTPILELPEVVAALPQNARGRVERLFSIDAAISRIDPPAEMHAWLEEHFGSAEAVREQRIVRVTNRWSLEGSLFSPLRARRPILAVGQPAQAPPDDPFGSPETQTPADTWGRVRGAHAVTGANAAAYEGQHGVVIFDRYDPMAFDAASVADLLVVGREWADRARGADPEASGYLLIWNAGPRAGGSVEHAHAQVLLGRPPHYAQLERWRRDAAAYRDDTGLSYAEDLVGAHRDLGLAVNMGAGVTLLASLTPIKEREVWLIGPMGGDEREPAFTSALARGLAAYRDVLGVRAFNLALWRPPIDSERARREGWDELLPPIVRIVDRGDPTRRSSDIGSMELYAASVIGTDPYDTIGALARAAP